MKIHALDDEGFNKLRAIADNLCGGTDRMRDNGNLLWLLIYEMECIEYPEGEKV